LINIVIFNHLESNLYNKNQWYTKIGVIISLNQSKKEKSYLNHKAVGSVGGGRLLQQIN